MSNFIFDEIAEVASRLYQLGWAERNAGNISHRLTENEFNQVKKNYNLICSQKIEFNQDYLKLLENYSLSKIYILISISGSRIRLMNNNTEDYFGIIVIDLNIREMTWFSKSKEKHPSSEYLSHIHLHLEMISLKSKKSYILHSHPTELIALSHAYSELTEDEFNDILWNMMPEVKMFVPQGCALIPYCEAGTQMLADLTVQKIKDFNSILWQKHGCLSTNETLWGAMEELEILNKAAYIFLISRRA